MANDTEVAAGRPVVRWLMALGLLLAGGQGAAAQESESTRPTTQLAADDGIKLIADSGAWTWFNDPRALVVDEDLLLVGSVDREGYSRVDLFDLGKGQRIEGGGFRLSTNTQHDDHNNPAFVQLDDGRILAAWSSHGPDRFWCYRFGTLDEASRRIDWGEERRYQVGPRTSYVNLFQLSEEDGRLYNFIRGLNFNPNVTTSDDNGQTWSELAILFQIGDGRVRPYVKYASDGKGRIDFLLTEGHPRDVRTGILHTYYEDGTLHHTDGREIAPMPAPGVDSVEPDDATRIYDGSQQRAWVWDIGYQPDGSPEAVFIVTADEDDRIGLDHRYHYARWDAEKKQWTHKQFAHAGQRLYRGENHYVGGVTLDPEHPGVVYFSTNVHPETGEPNEAGRYQIWRGRTSDQGETWSFEQLTSTPDANNLRPYVPRSHPMQTCVVWFQGDYRRYQDYETRVVGLFE